MLLTDHPPRDPAWLVQAQAWLHARGITVRDDAPIVDQLATLLAAVDTAAREKWDNQVVRLAEMQHHRDAWRGYAYGRRERPQDYLDGGMMPDDQGPSIESRIAEAEARGREAGRAAINAANRLRQHVEAILRRPSCDIDCSSNCDVNDDGGPYTSNGPCGVGAHFRGKVHVACSCGWIEDYNRAHGALVEYDRTRPAAPARREETP